MADQNADLWPIPKFHFTVDFEGDTMSCQEVTGLKLSTEHIEYRFGDDPTFTKQKIPGLKKYENITLKKGVFTDDFRIYEWYNEVQTDPSQRKKITISLLGDSADEVIMTWEIENAFPVSISAPDLNAEGNELAVETIELAHEGISLQQAPK